MDQLFSDKIFAKIILGIKIVITACKIIKYQYNFFYPYCIHNRGHFSFEFAFVTKTSFIRQILK